LKRDRLLDQYNRGRIMGYIETNPRGVYFTDIVKSLEMKQGTAAYHLRILERERLVVSRGEGTGRVFFPFKSGTVEGEKRAFWKKGEFYPSKVQQAIIDTIDQHPRITQVEISRKLTMRKDALHYHIRKLRKADIISIERKGGATICSLKDEAGMSYSE